MKYSMNELRNTFLNNLAQEIQKKPGRTFLILCAGALSIWYIGPLISIANHTPLSLPAKRLYTILLLVACWLLKVTFPDIQIERVIALTFQFSKFLLNQLTLLIKGLGFSLVKVLHMVGQFLRTSAKLFKRPRFNLTTPSVALENRFLGAAKFLKQTFIRKHGQRVSLNHLPLYLVIGNAGSGKTTFLANSNTNLVLSKPLKSQNLKAIPSSENCDWWVTRDQTLIDVPGSYEPSSDLWKNLLALVNEQRGKQALGGVVLTIPASDLMAPENFSTHQIKQYIVDLKATFGQDLPFYLAVTKCDQLPGFLEFFSDCGSDELAQAWGITIPSFKERGVSLAESFISRFDALIKRLNNQLIWRLHQERDLALRPQIKDFPLQIERLKESLADLFKTWSLGPAALQLQGVYLTSSVQEIKESHNTYQNPTTAVTPASTSALQLLKTPTAPVRSYFIRQFILKGLVPSDRPIRRVVSKTSYRVPVPVAAVSVGVISLAAILLGNDYRTSILQAEMITKTVSQYKTIKNQQDLQLAKALPIVNALQTAATDKAAHTILIHSDKIQETAKLAYDQSVQNLILPDIKNDLEKYLIAANSKTPANVYAALKAYLMLGNTQQLKPEFVTNILKQIEAGTLNPTNIDQLTTHFNFAMNHYSKPIVLNMDLINHVRRQLFGLPPAVLRSAAAENLQGNWVLGNVATASNRHDKEVAKFLQL